MKKQVILLLSAVLVLILLTGCKGSETPKEVNLTDFYNSLAERYGWEGTYLVDVTDELQETYYPGLGEYTLVQKVMKMPMMSSVVAEFAFVQCETEEDAGKVAEIFQKRADEQAEGGAWYPESMEAWGDAQVLTEGPYVALIAYAENGQEVVDQWKALFDE
ncbi:DUF4358 domain-containing protein [Oscillibacter sp. MSJ-2]|uniref:DUF4358 domain-containing protein n=1 Tax=Dysosmobacter acutus TaxID=2841504 RepID=A0ABS6FAL4_9FIRM|nr:DUF4358 domain-containing protein [Dysosmobacter acutus]MBU5627336.1 DUF4358 domain-containing protein [Dysosmobacter acutus]